MTSTPSLVRGAPPGRRVVALLFVAMVLPFGSTLASLATAWSSPTYAHGYMVAVGAVWLAWRELRGVRTASTSWPIAAAGLGVLSFVWLASTVTSLAALGQAALVLILFGWGVVALGPAAGRKLAPVAAFSLLAVPLWEVFLPALQAMTTLVSANLLRLIRVPAAIDGNVVSLQSGSFIIEGGCAGLNYLLAGLTLGMFYAQIFLKTTRGRLAVVGLAAGLAILGNWLRVTSIIVIGYVTRMQSGLVESHLTFGWALFALGLFAFFPLARRIERAEGARPLPASPAPIPDADAPGVWHSRPLVRTAAKATALAVAGPIIYQVMGALPARDAPKGLVSVSSEWHPGAVSARRWQPALTGATEYQLRSWTNGERQVATHEFVYRRQRQGAEMIGYGNRVVSFESLVAERLTVPAGKPGRLVNEAIVRDGDGYLLVWYWYRVGGAETESATRAKLLELWAFVRLARVSELIVLDTPCTGGSCTEASRTLSDFLGTT